MTELGKPIFQNVMQAVYCRQDRRTKTTSKIFSFLVTATTINHLYSFSSDFGSKVYILALAILALQ